MRYLLDTHTWIWWNLAPVNLSRKVNRLITVPAAEDELLLSIISVWEFHKLIQKKKLAIAEDAETWVEAALKIPGLKLIGLTPKIAFVSNNLPEEFHQDPADQIIVATARVENATVLSKDGRIQDYRHVKTIW